jgi:hypothetical protein
VHEEVLAGGVANPGAVVRVGDTVRRPRKPQTTSVHAYLQHLVVEGLAGNVPTPLGFDDADREVLTFIEGEVALPPFPTWVADDELLRSVAVLQRRLHHAAASFEPPPDAIWDDSGYRPAGVDGSLVCHNDLCVENVVVRNGAAVGLIDFDYTAPVDPLFDITVAVRHWAPVRAPQDLEPSRANLDVVRRFGMFVDAHELARDQRATVVDMLVAFLDHAHGNVQRLAAAGGTGFAAMIADGYLDVNRRSAAWVRDNRMRLID